MSKSSTVIIFGETHNDPIVAKILSKLLPTLKSLKFTHYFDETLRDASIETEVNQINFLEKIYQTLNDFFKRNNLDVHSREDWNHCLEENLFNADLLNHLGVSEDFFDLNYELFFLYAVYHEARLAYRSFLENLAQHKIHYKGIDSDIKNMTGLDLASKIKLTDPLREMTMASHYMNAKHHTVGHGGVGHLPAIQAKILANMSLENAKNKYIFIYISSLPEISAEYLKADYPLGLHYYDATKLSEEEIIQNILSTLAHHESQLSTKHHHLSTLSIFTPINKMIHKLKPHHGDTQQQTPRMTN